MKSFIIIYIIGITSLFSCNAKQADEKFNIYISTFEKIELPFSLDRNRIESLEESKKIPLDSLYINSFIEQNKELGQGIYMYDIYSYYSIGFFTIDENYRATIVEKIGGSGGVDNQYYLLIYYKKKLTDKILIAKEIGDCSFLNIRTGEIDDEFNILIKDFTLEGNCDNETYSEKGISILKYFIDKKGIIEKY